MIRVKHKGDFSRLTKFLVNAKKGVSLSTLEKYGKQGVQALASATPVDSGLTANSWEYGVEQKDGRSIIYFYNTNVNRGVQIAIILQYGHATGNGGWIEGIDYINPAIRPVFDKITDDAWKEVTKI